MAVACLFLGGCASAPSAQRGGVATIGKAVLAPITAIGSWGEGHVVKPIKKAFTATPAPEKPLPENDGMTLAQPENPSTSSTQNLEITHEETIEFAAPSKITIGDKTIEVPAGSKHVIKETRKAGQVVGASQKDTARADAAWLASFQWVQGVGILVMLAGIVGFAHPALRVLIGGKDTALMVAGAGAAMVFGPAFLQKYGNWFALALVGAGIYWFIARLKYKEAIADVHTGKTNPPFKP